MTMTDEQAEAILREFGGVPGGLILQLRDEVLALRARAEAAERVLAGEREVVVALNRRAEAAEAEVQRLRGCDVALDDMQARADRMERRAEAAEAQRDALAEALSLIITKLDEIDSEDGCCTVCLAKHKHGAACAEWCPIPRARATSRG
jgi:DNA repair exonuclease SbcCD ATPase subunit